jgi:hypothetical protein
VHVLNCTTIIGVCADLQWKIRCVDLPIEYGVHMF